MLVIGPATKPRACISAAVTKYCDLEPSHKLLKGDKPLVDCVEDPSPKVAVPGAVPAYKVTGSPGQVPFAGSAVMLLTEGIS